MIALQVRTRVIKTKYGRVQGFISRVGRDASAARSEPVAELSTETHFLADIDTKYNTLPTRPRSISDLFNYSLEFLTPVHPLETIGKWN